MIIHQLSIFLENKAGRLTEVLEVLGKENIRITALSVADTTEFGILRLIVPEPDRVKDILKKNDFTVNLTDVISVIAPNEAGNYARILRILSDIGISVEYTYAYSVGDKSIIILRVSNNEDAIEALKSHELELLKASDLFSI
jgi:hypothetical protein